MRTIEWTTRFKRDYRREQRGKVGAKLDDLLGEAIDLLRVDASLPSRLRDHSLTGNWSDCRDCHIRPDLVLIYQKVGDDRLILIRLGSHSELGL